MKTERVTGAMRVDAKWLDKVADYTARDLGLQDTPDRGKLVLDLIADLRAARALLARVETDYCTPHGEIPWERTRERVVLMQDVRVALGGAP